MGKGMFMEHTRKPITFGNTPSEGDMTWIDNNSGIIYNFDDTRGKWMSASRNVFEYARKGTAKGMYIPLLGDLDDSDDVYISIKNAIIVSIFCRSMGGDVNAEFELRKNGEMIYEFEYDGSNNRNYINTNLNLDINIYDKIQVYVNNVGSGTRNVVCRVETAWRYDI